MRVIDACAGASKSLHLLALMQNKGKVLSKMDVEEWKLKQTKLRARRDGSIAIIENLKVTKVLRTINATQRGAGRQNCA